MHVFEEGKKLNNVLEVPGVVEAGWTGYGIYRAGGDRDRTAAQGRLNGLLKPLLERVRQNKYCRLFIMNTPSESSQVISFAYIQDLFKQGDYYRSKEALGADLLRMVSCSDCDFLIIET